jgi:hypothetical protein
MERCSDAGHVFETVDVGETCQCGSRVVTIGPSAGRDADLQAVLNAVNRVCYGYPTVLTSDDIAEIVLLAGEVQILRRRVREAFTAGFLAVIKQPYINGCVDPEWEFNGPAAADLEPKAWAAWQSRKEA